MSGFPMGPPKNLMMKSQSLNDTVFCDLGTSMSPFGSMARQVVWDSHKEFGLLPHPRPKRRRIRQNDGQNEYAPRRILF
jgi:hypothetical protein